MSGGGGGEGQMNDSHRDEKVFRNSSKSLFMGQLRKFEIIICHNLGTFFLDMKNCEKPSCMSATECNRLDRLMENTIDVP
jgi:hypothetical protein